MKIINNLPTLEHEDFIIRNPMVDYKVNNMVIGWMIVDKDTDVPEYFQIAFTQYELNKYYRLIGNPVHYIMNNIINESVNHIINYIEYFGNLDYEYDINDVEFLSKLRSEVHTWFVHDNINILKEFEKMLKEKVEVRYYGKQNIEKS